MAILYASNETALFPASETSATSWAQAMAGASTPGNALITYASGYLNGATPDPTCSDTVNSTHTRAYFVDKVYGSEHLWAAVFYKLNIAAGTPTVTVANGTATSGFANNNTREYSGFATSGTPTDRTATNSGGSGVTALDSGTAAGAISQVDELLIGITISDTAGGSPTFTENVSGSVPSSGWLQIFERSGTASPSGCGVQYINTSTTPTPIHKWTCSLPSNGGAWLGILVTFVGAGAGGAGPTLAWLPVSRTVRIPQVGMVPSGFNPGTSVD